MLPKVGTQPSRPRVHLSESKTLFEGTTLCAFLKGTKRRTTICVGPPKKKHSYPALAYDGPDSAETSIRPPPIPVHRHVGFLPSEPTAHHRAADRADRVRAPSEIEQWPHLYQLVKCVARPFDGTLSKGGWFKRKPLED